jgi:hypothetical protein
MQRYPGFGCDTHADEGMPFLFIPDQDIQSVSHRI